MQKFIDDFIPLHNSSFLRKRIHKMGGEVWNQPQDIKNVKRNFNLKIEKLKCNVQNRTTTIDSSR